MSWVDTYTMPVIDGLAEGLRLFFVAAGLTVIYGVMRVLSLVHGTLTLAGAYLAATLFNGGYTGLGLAVAAGLLLGAAAGGLLDVAMRPLAGRPLDQALATLGAAFVAAPMFLWLFGASPLSVGAPHQLAGTVQLPGSSYPVWRLLFIAAGTLLAVGMFTLLERSRTGAIVRAVAADPQMASATGIPVRRVQRAVLAAGGALAVLGGVLGAPIDGPAPGGDLTILVQSLIVVVVGGPGSVRGALLAALAVGQVTTLGTILAPTASAFLLAGAMLVALAVRRAADHAEAVHP